VAEHRGLDEALLRDRCRALGERALFLELARPRRTRLQAIVATRASEAELDGALARLLAHLEANELLQDAELVIHVLGADGGRPSRIGAWERLDG
jgi:hypothetical protein